MGSQWNGAWRAAFRLTPVAVILGFAGCGTESKPALLRVATPAESTRLGGGTVAAVPARVAPAEGSASSRPPLPLSPMPAAPAVRQVESQSSATAMPTPPAVPPVVADQEKAGQEQIANKSETTVQAAPSVAPPAAQVTIRDALAEPHSQASGLGWVFVLGGIIGGSVIAFAYSRSETARVRRRVREILLEWEETAAACEGLEAQARAGVEAAAKAYTDQVRQGYLQSVSLDDVRKSASGARLQPLRESGVTNLLQLQGWSVGRLQQLRGIGPESAARIAYACAALTEEALKRRVPHPNATDAWGAAPLLFQRIRASRHVNVELTGLSAEIQAALQDLRPRCREVEKSTSLWHWLVRSEKKASLLTLIEQGRQIEDEMVSAGKWGSVLENCRLHIRNAKSLVLYQATPEEVRADHAQHEAFYPRSGVAQRSSGGTDRRRAAPFERKARPHALGAGASGDAQGVGIALRLVRTALRVQPATAAVSFARGRRRRRSAGAFHGKCPPHPAPRVSRGGHRR